MHVKLLGVRGTMPVFGPDFTVFGGATSSVLLRAGGETIILDAGSGMRGFEAGRSCSLLITHSHADHLLGFPAFGPFFDPGFSCRVYLRARGGLGTKEQLEALMSPPLWPVRPEVFRADMEFIDTPASFDIGPVRVDTMESLHPGGSTIYKLSFGGVSLVYATDYEPESDAPEDFCSFACGCSLLLLDAQYTSGEYARTRGFGHSTIERSAAIAANCGAELTLFIHHDPARTDAQLLELERRLTERRSGVRFGREGEEVFL